jgi:uncharacterized membrane protein
MRSDTDIKMDIVIGNLLRFGVSIAAAVVLTGFIIYLIGAHGVLLDYRHFHGTPITPAQFGSILRNAAKLDGRSVIQLGILLLVATPAARVIFCIIAFAVERDWLYVLVSTIVLVVLLYSLFFRP